MGPDVSEPIQMDMKEGKERWYCAKRSWGIGGGGDVHCHTAVLGQCSVLLEKRPEYGS